MCSVSIELNCHLGLDFLMFFLGPGSNRGVIKKVDSKVNRNTKRKVDKKMIRSVKWNIYTN